MHTYNNMQWLCKTSHSVPSAGPASLVRCTSAWYADGRRFDPPVQKHSFVAIGHEIISIAILTIPLIQEEQLSVTGERMCTKYWLTT